MHITLSSYLLEGAANAARPPLPWLWWLGPITALIALGVAFLLYRQLMQLSEGNDRMKEIAQAVREGAMAYLRRQYRVVAVVFGVLFAIFLMLAFFDLQNPIVPFAFLTKLSKNPFCRGRSGFWPPAEPRFRAETGPA